MLDVGKPFKPGVTGSADARRRETVQAKRHRQRRCSTSGNRSSKAAPAAPTLDVGKPFKPCVTGSADA
jgi:hypothetical protein